MHTNKNIRLWCRLHRTDLLMGAMAMVLATTVQMSPVLDGYILKRTDAPAEKQNLEPLSLKDRIAQRRQERLSRRRATAIARALGRVVSAIPDTAPLRSGPSVEPTIVISEGTFPPFVRTVQPVSRVPNWGAMRTPAEWERSYTEMTDIDFVPVPAYDLPQLVIPLQDLINPRNIVEITRKLYYSTRYFSAYDIDRGEFTGNHPGIDLKLPIGTPLGAIAGGKVHAVRNDDRLGIHIIVEHRHPTDGIFFSVYAHLGSASVQEGEAVAPGSIIGTVGMTGSTSGPHIHLQVDKDRGVRPHLPYAPMTMPTPAEAEKYGVNPITFMARYANGE